MVPAPGQSACCEVRRRFRFSTVFGGRGGWNTGEDKKKIGLPLNPDLLQDRTQLAAQRGCRGAELRRDGAKRLARHEPYRKPGLREGQSEIGREVVSVGASRLRIHDDDEGHRIGIEAEIDAEG